MEVIKRIIRIGTSAGIIIDKIILNTMKLKIGERVIVDIRREKDDLGDKKQ